MKLKNKLTGEIVNNNGINFAEGNYKTYNSLAELNEEWEDVPEEPRKTWFIDTWGSIRELETLEIPVGWKERPILKFDTKEEAEKAVEKLKAWKRLKDKGFRFVRIDEQNEGHRVGQYIEFEMAYHFTSDAKQTGDDLDLLFGGEE